MPLVSEQLGIQDASTTSVFLRQMALLWTQILNDTKNKSGYFLDSMQGVKVIHEHLKKGGKVFFQSISTEDTTLFETLLKSQRIPYVKIAEEKEKTYYTTRDIDKKKVEHVFDLYMDEKKKGFREFTPEEFIQDNAERIIFRAKEYTEAELMVFQKEAATLGFSYAVAGNTTNPNHFDILYAERDMELVGMAFRGLEYEFSGIEGIQYKMLLEQSIRVKEELLQEAKRNPEQIQYILSQNDPMHFATIKEGVLIEHRLSLQEQKDRNGTHNFSVKDTIRKTQPFGKKELTMLMKKLGTSILVPESSMTVITGMDNDGRVVVREEKELLNVLKQLQMEGKAGLYPIYSVFLDRNHRLGKEVTKEEQSRYEKEKQQFLTKSYQELPLEQQKLLDRMRSHEVISIRVDNKEQKKVLEQEQTRRYRERSF